MLGKTIAKWFCQWIIQSKIKIDWGNKKMNKLQMRVKEIIKAQGTKEEQMTYMRDVLSHGCVSGMVTELIYHRDTHAWFDEFYDEIEELREEFEENIGEPLRINGDLKNTLAWFSFEETLRSYHDQMEEDLAEQGGE